MRIAIATKAHSAESAKNQASIFTVAMSLIIMAATILLTAAPARADTSQLNPGTDYRPQDVVRIVIESLQNNSEASNDSGIATVFRFASPSNRASTGPLERFTRMVKGGFSDMLNHARARYDEMEVSGNTAVQAVWLLTDSGAEIGYAFQLGLQKSGEFEGMWMTEAVIPLGEGPQSGTRI